MLDDGDDEEMGVKREGQTEKSEKDVRPASDV
jgi:hypothetical protein